MALVNDSPRLCAGMDHTAAGHPVTDAKAPFEQQFIDMMAPHHEGAIAMAKVAQARAERPEIRQLADAIVSAQNREIQSAPPGRRSSNWPATSSWPRSGRSPRCATGASIQPPHVVAPPFCRARAIACSRAASSFSDRPSTASANWVTATEPKSLSRLCITCWETLSRNWSRVCTGV